MRAGGVAEGAEGDSPKRVYFSAVVGFGFERHVQALRDPVAGGSADVPQGSGPRRSAAVSDAHRLRSCRTLFARADPSDPVFGEAMTRNSGGKRDAAILAILASERGK